MVYYTAFKQKESMLQRAETFQPRQEEKPYMLYRTPEQIEQSAAFHTMVDDINTATTLRQIIDAVCAVPEKFDETYTCDITNVIAMIPHKRLKTMFSLLDASLAAADERGDSEETKDQMVFQLARVLGNATVALYQLGNKLKEIGRTGYQPLPDPARIEMKG